MKAWKPAEKGSTGSETVWTGRPRYGFYVDHMIDTFGAIFLMAGLATSLARDLTGGARLLSARYGRSDCDCGHVGDGDCGGTRAYAAALQRGALALKRSGRISARCEISVCFLGGDEVLENGAMHQSRREQSLRQDKIVEFLLIELRTERSFGVLAQLQ
jgi:hypothetical protein